MLTLNMTFRKGHRNVNFVILVSLLILATPALGQNSNYSTIKGVVWGGGEHKLLILQVNKGEAQGVETKNGGQYSLRVSPGRYRVYLLPRFGFPIPQERAPFTLRPNDSIDVNFLAISMEISSGAKGQKYSSWYSGDTPTLATYYFPSTMSLEIRELKLLYQSLVSEGGHRVFRYVFASYENLAFHAPKVLFDSELNVLRIQGDESFGKIRFENGSDRFTANKIEINLNENTYKILE